MTSTSKAPRQVEREVLDLLVEGRHGDPHAVLGAHPHHGRVTVRFEGPTTPPGPVRTFAADDPALSAAPPPDWTEVSGTPS